MEIHFVLIRSEDLEQVLTVFKTTAEKIAKKGIDHWQYWKNPPQEKVAWVKEGIAQGEFFFIKNANGNLLGMVRILNEDTLYWGEKGQSHENARYVHSLVVREKYNGNGWGRKILQKIQENTKGKGYRYLRLDCDASNPKLPLYYESLGFKKVGQSRLKLGTYNLYQKEL